jgi:hypothetical protein
MIVAIKPVPVVPVGACSTVLRQETTRRQKQQERKSIVSFGMTVLFMVCTVVLTSMILLNQVAFDAPTSIPQQQQRVAVVNRTGVQLDREVERQVQLDKLVAQKLNEYKRLLEQKREELNGMTNRIISEQQRTTAQLAQGSCRAPSATNAPVVVSYGQGSFKPFAPPKPEVNYQCVHKRAQRNVFRRDDMRSFM